MPLSREQLNQFDANKQHEFVLKAADAGSGLAERASSLHWILHWPHTVGVIGSDQLAEWETTKNDYIRQGFRVATRELVDNFPVAKDIIEAVENFIGGVVDYVTKTLGISTDRHKVIDQFKKSAGDIEKTLGDMPADVNKDLLKDGVIRGLRDASSTFSSIQAQALEEARDKIGEVTGKKTSKADDAAVSAATSTYGRIYENLMDDYKKKNTAATPEQLDEARRKAHESAARVSGVYLGDDGKFQPAKDKEGNYFGMFGYVHQGIKQVEAKQEITATFRLAPSDEISRVAQRAPAPTTGDPDVTRPVTPPVPTKQELAPAK